MRHMRCSIKGDMEMMSPDSNHADLDDPVCIIPTQRILLLEDDELLKSLITNFLKSNFHDVVAVSNGAEGVRAVQHLEFDIIICDMVMPKVSGAMFYNAVQRIKPHLCGRFIFVTGFRGNSEISQFIKKVHGTMIAKPFQMDELRETISFVQVKAGLCRNQAGSVV